jgi:serine phosphatase RsbU (regulator of sigma subunit)
MVYTDGIEDAQPASGQRFTEDGVVRTVKTVSETVEQVTARELGAQLVHAVQTHAGSHPQFDDIALVCFGRVLAGESQLSTDQRPTRVG